MIGIRGAIFARSCVEIFGALFRSIRVTMVALLFRMNYRYSAFIIAFLTGLMCCPQITQSQPIENAVGYFSPPLEIPLYLSGNFAELRRNHFHSGIDIKTQGVEGQKVVAAAEGFISRIRVSGSGYGNVLYIDHPNGYTTVYAHLQRFADHIQDIAKAAQYKDETFEIDLEIPDYAVPVKREELIAFSGNTGGSGGPHLHFEIRLTESELPLNPLLFDFPIEDNIPPTIRGLRVYPMNDSSVVSGRNEDRSYVVSGGYGKYATKNNEVVRVHGDIAFGIHTFDLLNGYPNKCGVFNIQLFQNDQLVFESQLDSLNFETFRQINTYKDYRLYHERGWHYHRSFLTPHNRLQVYRSVKNNGVLNLTDGETHEMRYEIRDSYGNLSVLNFKVESLDNRPPITQTVKPEPNAVFKHDEDNIFVTDDMIMIVPPYRLYEDLDFVYSQHDTLWACLTPVHQLHDELVPVDKHFTLRIRVDDYPEGHEEKLLVTQVNSSSHHSARGGRYKDGWISTRLREFGKFTVRIDTIPPKIRPINVFNGKSMKGSARMDFSISDNLSGIKHFEARVDGEWILMEYEPKNARLTHHIVRDAISPGEKSFVLKVTDERDNVAEYKATLNF